MTEALNAFVIRGIASNIVFQSALVRHPRFVEGPAHDGVHRRGVSERIPREDVPPENPAFLAAIAAAVHRAYRDRAAGIVGQMPGHELHIGVDYIVLLPTRSSPRRRSTVPGGCDVAHRRRSLRDPPLVALRRHPDARHLQRRAVRRAGRAAGLRYRLTHMGHPDRLCRCCRGARPSS